MTTPRKVITCGINYNDYKVAIIYTEKITAMQSSCSAAAYNVWLYQVKQTII